MKVGFKTPLFEVKLAYQQTIKPTIAARDNTQYLVKRTLYYIKRLWPSDMAFHSSFVEKVAHPAVTLPPRLNGRSANPAGSSASVRLLNN